MSTDQSIKRDERTVAVENVSYKWAFAFLLFALLIDVMCRGLLRREAAWDLMALVIVSSGLSTIYQARQRIWGRGWGWTATLLTILGGVIGFIVAAVLALTKFK
jgi:hypothetical protein